MVHEAFGLDEVTRRNADRLARAGYLTLAVDLFSTGGGTVRCLVRTMRTMMRGEGQAYVDIETARQFLADSPDCTGKIGIIGFCMGGGFALMTASRGFDASSANYGDLPRTLDDALDGACPIIATYGGRDKILKGRAARLEIKLAAHGVVHDVIEYPSAGHSYLNDEETGPRPLRPLMRVAGIGPEPDSAAQGWQRIDAFFAEHLR
jgi:carboxymethylenebutenolidase